jgi:two-component system, LytTR family, response regulator
MATTTKILTCIVVDDEPLAREVMSRYITRVPSLQMVAECENSVQAISAILHWKPDLLFVDIRMPEVLGTDLIKILNHPPKTIITTAYPEYAVESYELDVVDYLLKPIRFERFLKAIGKLAPPEPRTAAETIGGQEARKAAYLYFRTDRKMVRVLLDDILYVEGMKNYIKIFTGTGTVITKNSMAMAEAMLPEESFLRVHRSYIVARNKISSFTGEVITIGREEIPIGKLYRGQVIKGLE